MANSADLPISAKKGGMAVPCLVSPQKDARAGFQLFFHNVLLHIFLAPNITKLETYFAFLYSWTFAQCVSQRKKNVLSKEYRSYNIYRSGKMSAT